ncbi:MAG: MFS transporter [Burkholderiaceae bacterium]
MSPEPSAGEPHVFTYRPFAIFWASRVIGGLALQMQVVAVGWQVYELTGDPLDLGLVGLIQFFPSIILLLLVGQVADRMNRRWVVFFARILLALAVSVLVVASATGQISRDLIFVVVFFIGIAQAFHMPTSQAMIPGLVPAAALPKAIAWGSIGFQSASIIGPAIGGLLYIAGPTTAYSVCLVLQLLAAGLILAVKYQRPSRRREPLNAESLFGGFTFIRSHPVILGAISLDLFMVLLGGATALMPVFAREVLLTGPLGLGLLRAAPGVGAVGMAIVFSRWPIRQRVGRWMTVSAIGFGCSIIGFGLSAYLPLSLFFLVSLGAFDMINVVIRQSIVQLDTPDEMRGRVSSVSTVFIGASNQLGEFESGLTASLWGAVPATIVGGCGTVLVALLWIRLFPALWNRDRLIRSDPGPG